MNVARVYAVGLLGIRMPRQFSLAVDLNLKSAGTKLVFDLQIGIRRNDSLV